MTWVRRGEYYATLPPLTTLDVALEQRTCVIVNLAVSKVPGREQVLPHPYVGVSKLGNQFVNQPRARFH